MASYVLTGQKSKSIGGGGGVGFASTVQVIASDGSAKIRPVNTHGGYLDASMERYENDESLCFLDAVSDLDNVDAHSASTDIATEPLPVEGFAMASWNLDENSNDGYNSIPEGSWSWNGSTSGGDFTDGQLHAVYDNVKTSFQDQNDDETGHAESLTRSGTQPKNAKTPLSLSRAKAAAHMAPSNSRGSTSDATTTLATDSAASDTATTLATGSAASDTAATTLATGSVADGAKTSLATDSNAAASIETSTLTRRFYDRIKSAFRDDTEDQTSSTNAHLATPTNAQVIPANTTTPALSAPPLPAASSAYVFNERLEIYSTN
jgi:hypothetical protein